MLTLRVVQARYGDCLILENGEGKRKKHVLIDGGPSGVYGPYLRPVLEEINTAGGEIDLMVLSHVDNDHVVGLLDFALDIKEAKTRSAAGVVRVRRLWHNAFAKILPEAGSEAVDLEETVTFQPVVEEPGETPPEDPGSLEYGIREGVRLDLAEEVLDIPRNSGFPDGLVQVETARRPVRLGSLRLYVIGPSQENLDALRETWMRWLNARAGRISFDDTGPVIPPDDSVNNLSSIMLLAEGAGPTPRARRRILLTGDGRSADITAGLEQIGMLEPGGRLHVDVFKIPHHGSARNAVGGLFERITADVYVISADGRHGNPDPETLAWLLEAVRRQPRPPLIFATNWTDSLRDLVKHAPPEENNYRLEVLPVGERSALV